MRKTIVVSDLTGKPVDGSGARVKIEFDDARRGVVSLDVNEDEIGELLAKGQKQARRGRRPKSIEA